MTEILKRTHKVLSEEVDTRRLLRPSALLRMMQEIALEHSEILDLGTDATLDRNLLWVVTRYYIEIERMPRYEESVVLETWPGPMRRVLFPRYFRVRDLAGNILLKASSMWVLIDGQTRAMISPQKYGLKPVEGRVEGDELPYNVPAKDLPKGREESFTVPYSYLDLNGHMNNTKYLDVCEDLIADETQSLCLKRVSMEFQNEIHYKETVRIGIGHEENDYTFTGETVKPNFRIGLSYSRAEEL